MNYVEKLEKQNSKLREKLSLVEKELEVVLSKFGECEFGISRIEGYTNGILKYVEDSKQSDSSESVSFDKHMERLLKIYSIFNDELGKIKSSLEKYDKV